MSNKYQAQIDAFMDKVKATHGHEKEFIQAVHEVAEAVIPVIEDLQSDHTKVVYVSILL